MDDALIPPTTHRRNRPTRTQFTPLDRDLCVALRDYGDAQHWGMASVRETTKWESRAVWGRQNIGDDRFRELVMDYIRFQITEPVIRSMHEFTTQITWIEKQINKCKNRQSPTVIHPDVAGILIRCRYHQWPMGSDLLLPNVVQRSYDNARIFTTSLRTVKLPDEHESFRRHALTQLGSAAYRIGKWMDDVWHRVHNWKNWSGDLTYFIWHHTQPDVARSLLGLASAYRVRAGQWNQITRDMGL